MSALRLREAISGLHRARRGASRPLTREAERAIGRRVAARWGLVAVAVTAAGALTFGGANALVAAADDAAAAATASATPSPTLSGPAAQAVARIPLSGGPEFTQPDDAYVCGDPAPDPLPADRDLALGIGTPGDSFAAVPTQAGIFIELTYLGASDAGVATVGEITLLLVSDGRIAGAIENMENQLVWPLEPGASIEYGIGVFSDDFTCKRRSAEGQHKYFETTIVPGEYDLVAVARVFSTEESVALGQAVPPWFRLDESRKDPGGIYAPGSYDCARLAATTTVVRGCLPNIAPEATFDNGGGSVSVSYDASALVAPFETTLVSEGQPVTLSSWKDMAERVGMPYHSAEDLLRFASVNDVVCGATVNDLVPAGDRNDSVEVQSRLPDISALQAGTYRGSVMPWLARQGASVRLEAGARLAYPLPQGPTGTDSDVPLYEIVGFAPVEIMDALPYDRYTGPTAVQLTVGAPELCPNTGDKSVRLTAPPLLVGTWVVTAPNGMQTRHELVTTTWADLP